jgi:aldose 1-epimerase
MKIDKKDFGKISDSIMVNLFTLMNDNQMKVQITNYGGTITSIFVPDKKGNLGDVVLGFNNLEGYIDKSPYFGCIIGRFGNRIAKGRFFLDGKQYQMAINDGPNHLHGGLKGFDKVIWFPEMIERKDRIALKLNYLSKDGEEGYPGNLTLEVIYWLTNENEIIIEYYAKTDKKTIINLTNHSYFNLRDAGNTSILNHEITLHADYFTPIDKTLIPTGELRKVQNTPFDFREPVKIGARIDAEEEQIKFAGGYDHNLVLRGQAGELRLVAKAFEPETGRILEVLTTEPGIQLYSGNFLDGTIKGKNGIVYHKRHAFCLETQHYPDSPNKTEFPSTVLIPGEEYKSTTVFKFSVA